MDCERMPITCFSKQAGIQFMLENGSNT